MMINREKYVRKKKKSGWMPGLLIIILLVAAGLGAAAYRTGYLSSWLPDQSTEQMLSFSMDPVCAVEGAIPDYNGRDVLILQNNQPGFTDADMKLPAGEGYSRLDTLGRCGTACAVLTRQMMPTKERDRIGEIRPSGWHTVKYPGLIEGNFLYNRCHLIAYALTGQNANERNLITGTRHLNNDLMLPYELQVARYLDHSSGRVLYRVTPWFHGKELVARGVEMEALSVEDNGEGVCFHVFLYNVQPGIRIDYRTGESVKGDGSK